jgi:hypothetical protein
MKFLSVRRNRFGEAEFDGLAAFLNIFSRKWPCDFCGLPTTRETAPGHSHYSCAVEFNKAVARDDKGFPLYDAKGQPIMEKKLVPCSTCGRASVEGQVNRLGKPLCSDCQEQGQQALAFLENLQTSVSSQDPLTKPITSLPGAAPGGKTKFLFNPRTATSSDYEKLIEYLKNPELGDEERQLPPDR